MPTKLTSNNTLHDLISCLHQVSMPVAGVFPRWILGSLPDALWCYACVSFILICWKEGPFFFKVFWLSVAIALSLGFELGQLLHIIPGTFCPYDLVSSMAAIAVALSHEVFHREMSLGRRLRNGLARGSLGASVCGQGEKGRRGYE